jgi:drug/metabolite transporter (DMT)-like permease
LTGLAFLLLLSAAFFHAFWNYISKKACGGAVFVWLFNAVASVIYIPVVISAIWLTKSQVPLARGSGPLLSTLAAVFFLGEQPSLVALMGTVFIAVGVFLLLGNPAKYAETKASQAILFAILTGFFIASYTLWDKYAVSIMAVPPILMYWGTTVCQALLMLPYAMKNRETVTYQWKKNCPAVFWVAVLCPLSYILVLTAMVFTPVSYVAPAREVSILIGAIMGARFLAEGDAKLRIAAAIVILAGLTCLALG